MALDQHASNLIDLTVKTFNGDVTNVSPTDGISLIDSWISFLQTDNPTNSALAAGLSDLKAVLQAGGNVDSSQIQDIMSKLTQQTKQLGNTVETDDKPKLDSLVTALQSFSQLLSGSGGPAKTGGQAPLTSTVGASALTDTNDDDDLSGRNGGTTSSGPSVDMDDTTGSDGGTAEARVMDENNDRSDAQTGDSGYSGGSDQSRSDTARVGGMGVSGGTGDTDTTQSGGRSQY